MRKYIPTIIFFVIFVGLLIFVLFNYKDKTNTNKSQVLFQANRADITSVEYTTNTKMEFKNINNVFGLFVPQEVPSEISKIDEFVNKCLKIEYQSLISQNESNLSQYGLDNPLKTIKINKKDSSFSFSIGDKTPTSDGYYIKDSKNNVYKISSELGGSFEQEVNYFINKKVVNLNKDTLDKIVVNYDGEKVLEKANGSWKYGDIVLNQNMTNQLFDQANSILIDGLLPEERYFDTTMPDYKVAAYQGDKTALEIAVKILDEGYAVAKSGVQVQYYMSKETFGQVISDTNGVFQGAKTE